MDELSRLHGNKGYGACADERASIAFGCLPHQTFQTTTQYSLA